MHHEHHLGRQFVAAMAEALLPASQGQVAGVKAFADAAIGYTALLRQHIQKEDRVLYPMAAQIINERDLKELQADFVNFERKEEYSLIGSKYVALAEILQQRFGREPYGVEGACAPSSCGGCCGCDSD